ncbi:hypothetical protein OAT96_01245 [Chitinophagales bacterium]|nr:hypothetical protein [Chitinophagales bacterium]
MRNLNLFIVLSGLVAVSFFSNCEEDKVTPEGQTPMLTVSASGLSATNTIMEGSTFDVTVVASENPISGRQLSTLEIQILGVDSSIAINAASYTETFALDAPADGVSETYTFIVTDSDGESASKSLTVSGITGVVSTPFGPEIIGDFFHVGGSLEGAYDLVAETVVASAGSEADKDMKNIDMAGGNFTGSWTTGTSNGSQFVKSNTFDYANGTVEDAMAVFEAGQVRTTILNPSLNDIFIVKLRGGSDYALLQVTDRDVSDNTCNCSDLGKLTFKFKKS